MKFTINDLILLDLFSGTGGFHKGLSDAGFSFKEVYFSEIDKHAVANYKYNHPNAKEIGSIENVLRSGIPRPDVITFGSPCQDFSLAGKRKGLDGNRSSLIEYALKAISHFRPDIFIWENVKGAFSSNSRRDFWAIIQAFANIGGYELEWQLVNTSWILPQNRERIYLVGRSTTAFRSWRNVFPVTESFRKTDIESRKYQNNGNPYLRNTESGLKINHAGRIFKGQDGVVIHDNGLCPAICVGHGVVPKILVKSATKKGYEEAGTGDTIDLKYSESTTRRGKVGKQIAHTLDCGCNQGVIQLNLSVESNGKQPFQQNRIYDSKGFSPALSTDVRSPMILALRGRQSVCLTSKRTEYGKQIRKDYEKGLIKEKRKFIQQLEPRTDGLTNTLTTVQKDNLLQCDSTVRRLTEIECERLQGYPDDWTKFGNYEGIVKEVPKTQRYKLMGNAVTVKMVQLIGERILPNYREASAIRIPFRNDGYSNGDYDTDRMAA